MAAPLNRLSVKEISDQVKNVRLRTALSLEDSALDNTTRGEAKVTPSTDYPKKRGQYR
jgi:hypothetical protein